MRRIIIYFLALALMLVAPAAALADGGVSVLDGTAIITQDQVFYTGSVDGTESGIFVMERDGTNVVKIYDEDMMLIAYSNGKLLIYNWELESLVILDASGNVVSELGITAGSAISDGGYFYAGAYRISDDGSQRETLIEVSEDDVWMVTPVAISGDRLYYLDNREYGMNAAEYDNPAALKCINLSDKSISDISPAGTSYIGIDGDYIYYARSNFSTYSDDPFAEDIEVEVDQGLFRANLDGSGETRLADINLTDDVYTSYSFVSNGMIYGVKSDYTTEEQDTFIVRVDANGNYQPEHAVDGYYTLCDVADGKLICVKVNIYTDNDDYTQVDQIVNVNLDTMEEVSLNNGAVFMLDFTESEPQLAVSNGAIFFVSYDVEVGSSSLYRINLDGSDLIKLANGYQFFGDGGV